MIVLGLLLVNVLGVCLGVWKAFEIGATWGTISKRALIAKIILVSVGYFAATASYIIYHEMY